MKCSLFNLLFLLDVANFTCFSAKTIMCFNRHLKKVQSFLICFLAKVKLLFLASENSDFKMFIYHVYVYLDSGCVFPVSNIFYILLSFIIINSFNSHKDKIIFVCEAKITNLTVWHNVICSYLKRCITESHILGIFKVGAYLIVISSSLFNTKSKNYNCIYWHKAVEDTVTCDALGSNFNCLWRVYTWSNACVVFKLCE